MVGNLGHDVEAQHKATNLDVPTTNGSNERDPEGGGCANARAPAPAQCGMGTIGIWEIITVLMIANKFVHFVGKDEMPENVQNVLMFILTFCVISILIVDCCTKKMKLILPCFGSQIIRLIGFLIFLSYHIYGYLKKDDIFFSYNYDTNTGFDIFFAVIFWLWDAVFVLWVIFIVYKCFAYLHDLNKNYQSTDAFTI